MPYLPSLGSELTLGIHVATFLNTSSKFVGVDKIRIDPKTNKILLSFWVGEFDSLGGERFLIGADMCVTCE